MCTLGIQRIVNREVKKKPYLRYNGTDFITIPLVGEINSINVMGIARSLAEQFNKKINDGKNIGKVFYAEQGSDVTGVGIRPTPSQLTVLNQPNNNLYRYFDSKESTATEVLKKIEKLGGGLGSIAKKLLENPIDVPVIIVDSDEVTENVQAHYDPTDKVIRVAKDAKFPYSTESLLVHEILHAYTSSYLVSDAGAKERQQLQDVLDYLKSNKISSKIKDKYPLGSVEELLVGIFTNPSLIRDLKQIPARSNSFAFVWNEILDIFKSIFGIKDATMFDEVFNISSQIVDSSTKNRDNEEQDRLSALAMYYDYEENAESAEDEIEREIMKSEREVILKQEKYPIAVEYNEAQISQGLKATNILQSEKATQFFNVVQKNKISGDLFWKKMQTDLAIPKEQIEILKSFNTENKDELISSLLANYSYTIEINIARGTSNLEEHGLPNAIVYNGWAYEKVKDHYEKFFLQESEEEFEMIRISKEEYEKAVNLSKNNPTQHYAYLTVPGGTNYTENEIATPAIKPAIKGHAQFATDNGIGWFRSDDFKVTKGGNTGESYAAWQKRTGANVKTRRILEVQSDLFQKGRDKEELTQVSNWLMEIDETGKFTGRQAPNVEVANKRGFKNYKEDKTGFTENQFLQLLNKGNNWVSFFIKSIVQDSIKKGYEKVLFPSGNTASKVEGHETLEQFKKHKEDRIKDLENKKPEILESDGKFEVLEPNMGATIDMADTRKEAERLWNERFGDKYTNEIKQLKKELEDVEKNGFSALKPIFNFYENTVTNILNKTYGENNVKQITDEYGNTWNEITLKKERDLSQILLQKQNSSQTKANKNTQEKVKEFLRRAGVNIVDILKYAKEHNLDISGVNGLADTTRGLIAVVNGKEDEAITEEAMHIAVAIIKQKNPTLYKQLTNEVVKYGFYKAFLEEYRENKLYQKDGKPDFDKLKEEAVGKLLAEYFINKSENLSEKPENMVKIQSMWERVKQFLKSLIGKTNIDVFAQALSEVESGNLNVSDLKNGDVFLQTSETQDAVVGKIKAMNNNIAKKLSPTLKDENGKPKDSYFYNGVEMLNRVTDKAKKFYEKIFRGGDVNKSEYQKLLMDLYSENGTLLHEDQQHIIGELTDAEGKFVDKPFQFGKYKPKTTIQIYETLYENMRDRMKLYPGSVFLSEVMLVDSAKSIGGTSDLLVIKPDGSIKILDWKFMDMQTDKFQDVAWYKKKAFDIQISEYRRIISEQFGIPLSKITGEAIPIKTNYVYTREMVNGKQVLPKLTGVIIGEADPKLEENDYLLPVPISSQSTGDAELDKLLKQLSALKANMESVTVKSAEEKEAKAEQINAIEKAMRHIAVKQSLTPLVDQAEVYTKDVRDIVDTFNELYKDLDFAKVYATDKEQFTKDVNDFGLRLDRALDQIKIYSALDVDLSEFFGTDVSEEAQELQEKIAEVTKTARFLEKGLLNTINAFAEKIAEAEGFSKITSAETQVTGSSKLLSETSKLQMKTLQVFYAKRRAAQNEAEIQTNEEILQLKKLGEAYEKLALSKGLTKKNMFNLIMDYNENKLINQYSKEFYDLLKEKVAVATRDYKWIEQNVDVAAFKAAMQEKLDSQIELIENKNISDEEKEILIENKIKSFDTSKTDSPGWYNNYPLLSQFPLSKWESTEWKTMNATGNEAAVELYNWVLKINKKANDIGYLPQGNSARNFLPYVVKSFAEKMVFGGDITLGEEFIRSMTIDEDSVGYGAIDKLTNKPINKIPKYFTNKSDKELSVNLIKNLGLYNQALNNYKFISETEGIARVLSRVERNKGSIVTDKIGNAVFDKNTGTFETSTSNESNADLFDKQIATLVYGQKYVQSESFDQLLGSVGDSFEKVNKVLGFKLLPEGLKDRQFSLNKSLDTLNRYFQQKTLGFNPLPAISNLVGGKLQLTISSGKYMTKADVMKADLSLLGAAVSGEKGKKLIAALKYFLPFTSNETNQELIKKLSVTDLTEHHIQELLMVMMRSSDKYIQATIFSALFDNSVLIDGNIYNAREYVRNNTDYKDRYASGNLEEQENKFNSLVEELLKKQSLESQSSINDKGELVIKGLERSSAQAFALKNLSQALNKRATGSLTNAEVRGMNQNILSNSFMVFKNWIPSLIDVRFGKMKYASDVDAYEWGRTRTVARIMSREGLSSISTLVDLLSFNTFALSNSGKIVKANKTGLEQLEELYVYKKQQYLQQTGRELDMTKAEFFDMVRQNIRNQAKDTLITLSLIAMFLALKANVPDKDEDEDVKNRHKFMVKVLDRLSDEVSFYYSPTSFQTILNGSVMPSIGLLTDGANVLSHFMKEMYDLGVGDDKAAEKNYVWKYVFRSFPLVSQMSTYMPLYAPELAKDLGIKSTAQARR